MKVKSMIIKFNHLEKVGKTDISGGFIKLINFSLLLNNYLNIQMNA